MLKRITILLAWILSIGLSAQTESTSNQLPYYWATKHGLVTGLNIFPQEEDFSNTHIGARIGYYYRYSFNQSRWNILGVTLSGNLDYLSNDVAHSLIPNVRGYLHLAFLDVGVGYYQYVPFVAHAMERYGSTSYGDIRFNVGVSFNKMQLVFSIPKGFLHPNGPDYVIDSFLQFNYHFE
ncbi:hypothetical protein [Phaeocystidibacter marisrubri]|uniref:Acyloxyacyl hydrolase n=1 Tax=Phaeocystidibacter marisrubri TaxID=1577780 RepID=A0A6L3ZJP9_9FLAO|nr:hypothetical protein [Phaeocystidibacter marisrubri]KAB2818047.1 hypothetical protein F8C82_06500 [Phaeocystidibacter marisrubri]GGH72216.1 hypothetical protein GCM10011318_15960 [Phaeocystidibacter marisrubri]